jgi:hypothetical protein
MKREMKDTGLGYAVEELAKLIPEEDEYKVLSIFLKAIEIEKEQMISFGDYVLNEYATTHNKSLEKWYEEFMEVNEK